jgi:hypothetical protein
VLLHVSVQLPPGLGQLVEVVFASAGQSGTVVQHVVLPMQRLPHTFSPVGQVHVPPAPEQVSAGMVQGIAGQQLVVGMQALLVVQNVCPVGQLHEPPGPEHVPPPGHCADVQHVPEGMHELKAGDVMVQTEPPFGQVQSPPGPVHVSPVTRQSLLVQHVLLGMHVLFTVQTLSPEAHWHRPPGAGQVSPLTAAQSAVVQHEVVGMQELLATQPL